MLGRVRCAHQSNKFLKPSFVTKYDSFDKSSKMEKTTYYDVEPHDPLPDDAWDEETGELKLFWKEEFEDYKKELEEFENEEPTLEVLDVCYSIISDKDVVLPLEEVLRRFNLRPEFVTRYCTSDWGLGPCNRIDELFPKDKKMYKFIEHCMGHIEPHNYFETPFSGLDLAFYVRRWMEQFPDGKVLWFGKV